MFLITILLGVVLFYVMIVQHQMNKDLSELEDTVEQMIDALLEDANSDYQERVDRMFTFITEELDPEDEEGS